MGRRDWPGLRLHLSAQRSAGTAEQLTVPAQRAVTFQLLVHLTEEYGSRRPYVVGIRGRWRCGRKRTFRTVYGERGWTCGADHGWHRINRRGIARDGGYSRLQCCGDRTGAAGCWTVRFLPPRSTARAIIQWSSDPAGTIARITAWPGGSMSRGLIRTEPELAGTIERRVVTRRRIVHSNRMR